MKKKIDSLEDKLRYNDETPFEVKFGNNGYKSGPRSKYEEEINKKYINYSSVDRSHYKNSDKISNRSLSRKFSNANNYNSRRVKRFDASGENRNTTPQNILEDPYINRFSSKNRDLSHTPKEKNIDYERLYKINNNRYEKAKQSVIRRSYQKFSSNDLNSKDIILKVKEDNEYESFSLREYQREMKNENYKNIVIETPAPGETSALDTVYTSVANFKDLDYRPKGKDSIKMEDYVPFKDEIELERETGYFRESTFDYGINKRYKPNLHKQNSGASKDKERHSRKRRDPEDESKVISRRSKSPNIENIFGENTQIIFSTIKEKSVNQLVDYLYDDFLDSIESSIKTKTAFTLLFEVKMGSKKLNREPILYSLLTRYQQ